MENKLQKSVTKLTSLFSPTGSLSEKPVERTEPSLVYKAPKRQKSPYDSDLPPPTATSEAQRSAGSPAAPPSLLYSCTVRLLRYDWASSQYQAVSGGEPLGCVIMRTQAQYALMIYDQAKTPQLNLEITPNLEFRLLPNNYITVQCKQGGSWSILFPSEELCDEFALRLATVRFHGIHLQSLAGDGTSPAHEKIELADVGLGSADSFKLACGDTAGFCYTVWRMATEVETNPALITEGPPFCTTVNKDITKTRIGEDGKIVALGLPFEVQGMAKHGKRLFSVPSSIIQESTELASLESCLVLFEIVKVKYAKKTPGAGIDEQEHFLSTPEELLGSKDEADSHQKSIKERMAALAAASGMASISFYGVAGDASAVQAKQSHEELQMDFSHSSDSGVSEIQQQRIALKPAGMARKAPEPQFLKPSPKPVVSVKPIEEEKQEENVLPPKGIKPIEANEVAGVGIHPAQLQTIEQTGILVQSMFETLQGIESLLKKQEVSKKNIMETDLKHLAELRSRHSQQKTETSAFVNMFKDLLERHEYLENSSANKETENGVLQARVDELQRKNIDLLNEKSSLLEKYADSLQKLNESKEREKALEEKNQQLEEALNGKLQLSTR